MGDSNDCDAWQDLARRAWLLLDLPCAVRPSIPILYFGDLEAYRASKLRIITVGLNPSREEFPRANPFQRFPGGDRLDRSDVCALKRVLAGYFKHDPYESWFDSYEWVLTGLGASYYRGSCATTLHTDLFSPIATDPTWTGLGAERQRPYREAGLRLWHDLVGLLRPHLVILSVARKHLDELRFPWDGPWRPLHTLTTSKRGPRRKPYVVECRTTREGPVFVFGPAAQKPFGTVSGEDRIDIGQRVRGCPRLPPACGDEE